MLDSATKSTLCLIRDALSGDRISLRVRPADTVHSLYEAVRLNMDRSKDTIQLLLGPSAPASAGKAPVKYNDDQLITLPDSDHHTLAQIGVDFAPTRQHTVIMRDAPPANNATAAAPSPTAAALPVADTAIDSTSSAAASTMNTPPSPQPPSASFDDFATTMPQIGPMHEKRTRQYATGTASSTNSPTSTTMTTSLSSSANGTPTSSASPPAAVVTTSSGTSARICAPPPPPPGHSNHNGRHNGSGGGGDDVMDVDQDHTPHYMQSESRRGGTSAGASTSGGMLMLYSPPTPQQRTNNGYVGLVNQAMTCYLNSLLQALFMTPEFRNAMYKWEYKTESEHRRKCIPFELQKLFLQLQTSARLAVETTDLTRSFGWDSSEAWQQHDVQELCRVMFDALEHTFKRTAQADLINRLYEGKMIDYVQCLECQTEKQREDAFLDIPLPVKPFGSTVAYESIEEALSGFVEPERLDGTNQYFCEKCNCKCDAHKGLKFARFPYILTLHLKRFDFDYQTFHRIKLNDKVTFPQTLNLNHFVKQLESQYVGKPTSANTNAASSNNGSATSEHGSVESAIKGDDCSTTDSDCGVLDDDIAAISSSSPNNNNNNNNINNNITNGIVNNNNNNNATAAAGNTNGDPDLMLMQEDDEGIDVTSTTDTKSSISTLSASGAAAASSAAGASIIAGNESGPYIYELFAIMIHSGSASGGHYYAYIKEFESGEWYCFNDQSVTTASQEDINKSFGGGCAGAKAYYSGAYSSSTNAYMLMYRQLDPQRNVAPMKPEEFPAHIQLLMQRLHDKKEADRYAREQEEIRVKFTVYCRHPHTRQLRDKRIYMNVSQSLEETLAEAHDMLEVSSYAPLARCRLVAYDHSGGERVTRSFEGEERLPLDKSLISQLMNRGSTKPIELLLETRTAGDEDFEPIRQGSFSTLVHRVADLIAGDVDDEHVVEVRTMESATVGEYKATVARKLHVDVDRIVVALLSSTQRAKVLDTDSHRVGLEDMEDKCSVFVTTVDTAVPDGQTVAQRLVQIVERFKNILTLFFLLPNTDKETLEKMSIPSYEETTIDSTPSPSPPSSSSSSSSAKRSPHANADRCTDVTMSMTPSPTRPITIATSTGQWNATCDVDVVDAHMTVAPALHHNHPHHHHHGMHNTTSFTMKLPRFSSGNDSTSEAAAAGAAITTTATVKLPLGRSGNNAAAASSDAPESNSEDSSLSDSDRTLVDDTGAVADLADLSSTNNSPACSDTQLSSPEYLSRRITSDFDCDDDDDDVVENDTNTDDIDLYLDAPHNGHRGASAGTTDALASKRKYYFRATLLDDDAAAALAAAASSSSSSVTNTTNNGSSSNSSTTGEYGPKQQQQRTLKVKVEKNMIMGNLKQALERYVCVPKEYLKIFRQAQSHSQVSESECTSLKQTLQQFKEGERLVIELGRALRKGEFKCKVFYMRLADCNAPDFDRLQPVCDYILCSGADVGSTKRAIISQLASIDPKYNAPFDTCRLRRKSYKSPMEVYQDELKFGEDITMSESFELILQECDESSQPCTNADDKTLFLRRWNPSKYTLSPMQEIVLVYEAHDDLRQLIANVTSPTLSADDIQYMKVTGSFPFTSSVSVLSVHANSSWTDQPLFADTIPLSACRAGEMYFYRDKNEPLGELTAEERRTISRAENASGASSYGSMSVYSSPRRERALKIYLDPSPKKASSFDLMN